MQVINNTKYNKGKGRRPEAPESRKSKTLGQSAPPGRGSGGAISVNREQFLQLMLLEALLDLHSSILDNYPPYAPSAHIL